MKALIGIVEVLLAASAAWGQAASGPALQAATQPVRSLEFVVAPMSKAITWKGEHSPEQIIRPTYAGVIAFTPGRSWQPSPDEGEVWAERQGPDLPGISPRQRAFLRQHVYVVASVMPYDNVTFFAVTEEDARQMATLFIEHLDNAAKGALEGVRQRLQASLEVFKEAPARIEEYAVQYKQVAEQMAARRKSVGIEGDDWEKWSRTVDEDKANLRALDIERTGQLARLRKIQEYMAQQTQPSASGQATHRPASQLNPAVLTTLETMLVELNVEMAGTQAKRDLLEKDMAPWQELRELYRKRREAEDARMEWQRKLERAPREVEQLPQTLANPPAAMLPIQVKDDTVRIVPVRAGPASQVSE